MQKLSVQFRFSKYLVTSFSTIARKMWSDADLLPSLLPLAQTATAIFHTHTGGQTSTARTSARRRALAPGTSTNWDDGVAPARAFRFRLVAEGRQ